MDKILYTPEKGKSLLVPIFNGKIIEKMPELISQGYIPISISEIMEQRIKAWESKDKGLISLWEKNYFDSGDGIIYHPDGRIKIVLDSQNLKNINPNTQLNWYGAQVLPEQTFQKTQGIEFTRNEIKEYANKYLKKKEVLSNPIWLALVREDKQLLKEYTYQVFSKINHLELMKIWISNSPHFEAQRLFCLDSLDFYSSIDGINFGQTFENIGCLIGIKPNICKKKQLSYQKNSLETLVRDIS